MYELNWGKDGTDAITDENGEKVSLNNLDDLYDYLLKNYD